MSNQAAQSFAGHIGNGHFFSDVFARCVFCQLTGGLVVVDQENQRQGRIFFRRGRPFHVSGTLFEGDDLGAILSETGSVPPDDIKKALEVQKSQRKPTLLGRLLRREGKVSKKALERALELQTKRRIQRAFGIRRGAYKAEYGADIGHKKKGLEIDGASLILPALKAEATDVELRRVDDFVLGKAVNMSCAFSDAEKLGIDEADREILRMLLQPRRVVDIERQAKSRKGVRALLRALMLANGLQISAAKDAVAFARHKSGEQIALEIDQVVNAERTFDEADVDPAPQETHFDILGVQEGSSVEVVRTAYTNLMRQYHPDVIADQGPERAKEAEAMSAKLNEAYQVLSDPTARAEYEAQLKDYRVRGDAAKAALVQQGEMKLEMAKVLIRKRDFENARQLLMQAIKTVPSDARLRSFLAWAMWLDNSFQRPDKKEKVLEMLRKAVDDCPDGDTHYFYAKVLSLTGDDDQAGEHFRKAVMANPSHRDAVREVRLLKMRRAAAIKAADDFETDLAA